MTSPSAQLGAALAPGADTTPTVPKSLTASAGASPSVHPAVSSAPPVASSMEAWSSIVLARLPGTWRERMSWHQWGMDPGTRISALGSCRGCQVPGMILGPHLVAQLGKHMRVLCVCTGERPAPVCS